MPITVADLVARLGMDTKGFNAGVAQSTKGIGGLIAGGTALGNVFVELGKIALQTAAALATFPIEATKTASRYAELMSQLEAQTGLAARTFQSYSVILERVGGDQQGLALGLKTLSTQIFNANAGLLESQRYFRQLGLSVDSFKGKNTQEVFEQVALRLGELPAGFERTAIAAALFGRQGGIMLRVLADGPDVFERSRKKAEEFGLVLSESANKQLAATADKFDDLNSAVKGFVVQFGVAFGPLFDAALDGLTSFIAKVTSILKAWNEVKTAAEGIAKALQEINRLTGATSAIPAPQQGGPKDLPFKIPKDLEGSLDALPKRFVTVGEAANEAGKKIVEQTQLALELSKQFGASFKDTFEALSLAKGNIVQAERAIEITKQLGTSVEIAYDLAAKNIHKTVEEIVALGKAEQDTGKSLVAQTTNAIMKLSEVGLTFDDLMESVQQKSNEALGRAIVDVLRVADGTDESSAAQEQYGKVLLATYLDAHRVSAIYVDDLVAQAKAQQQLGKNLNEMQMQQPLPILHPKEPPTGQQILGEEIIKRELAQQAMLAEEERKYYQELLRRLEIQQRLGISVDAQLDNEQQGVQIQKQLNLEYQHRNDTLEGQVLIWNAIAKSNEAAYQVFSASSYRAEVAQETAIKAQIARQNLAHQNIIDNALKEGQTEQQLQAKLTELVIQGETERMRIVGQFPGFWAQQLDSIVKSNTFSVSQITTLWTSNVANAIVTGNQFLKQTWQATQVFVVQAALNTGIQLAAQWVKDSLIAVAVKEAETAAIIGLDATKNATVVAGNTAAAGATVSIWTAAATGISGAFVTITAAFTAMMSTLGGIMISIGTAVMTFLTAIAEALTATVFGIPYAGAILVGVGLIAAALATFTDVFEFAEGGIVKGPTLGLVGEAGPEAIIPLSKMDQMGFGGTLEVPVYLNGREIARAVADDLPSAWHRMGLAR